MAVRDKAGIAAQMLALLPNNSTEEISPADIRAIFTDMLDSLAFRTDVNRTRFVDGTPDNAVGVDGDVAIDYTGARLLERVAGVYVLRFTVSAGGGSEDGVADSVTLALAANGTDLTVTIGRTESLADIDSTITLPLITDDEAHQLSQIPGLEAKTQGLVVLDTYVWADTTDWDIALRSDAPPTPWLTSALWDPMLTISSQDTAGENDYLVLRGAINADVTKVRVEITRGTKTLVYSGSAFRRIHKTQTSHAYYAHPNSVLHTGDELQVQLGTLIGSVTEFRDHVGNAKVDASGFDGNLSTDDDTIQEIAQALDDLVAGGGGGAAESLVAFIAPLGDVAAADYSTAAQILDVGTVETNEGTFVVDTSGTTDLVTIPDGQDGVYDFDLTLRVNSAAGETTRAIATLQATVETAGVTRTIAVPATKYLRNFDVASRSNVVGLSLDVPLLGGDKVGATLASSNSDDLTIDGDESQISIVKQGGAKGDKGDDGDPGTSGGATITSGTADPAGGSAGDAYIQVDASSVIQSIWRNVAGTWTEYTLPAAAAGGFTLHTGNAAPATSLGDSGDWYLRTSNGQLLEKVSTTWHGRFTPPALSDADPEPTGTAADSGTATAAARADHVHVGLALSDDAPEDVGTAAAGTSDEAARADHVHGGVDGGA